MVLTEYLTTSKHDSKLQVLGYEVPSWIWKSYCVIGVFGFGAACSQLTTDVMKYTIGRLRPHFYTVCLPNVNCSHPAEMYKYHINFQCTNPDYINNSRIIKELR